MKIFLLLSIVSIAIIVIFRNFLYSAKRNLFKDQSAWSGKDIKIKYTDSKKFSESNKNENYLKIIANESKIYIEDQSKKQEEESK